MDREKTFLLIKPDGVQRGVVGDIVKRLERKGFKLVAIKFTTASEEILKEHYNELATQPFFTSLISYMSSGPVVPMVWEGLNIIQMSRRLLGEKNPESEETFHCGGTIRGDFGMHVGHFYKSEDAADAPGPLKAGRNIIHGADSVPAAQREIKLWFKEEELISWDSIQHPWLYE